MNSNLSIKGTAHHQKAIRVIALGAVYAGAVFFAVALSPAVGNLNQPANPGAFASAETSR